METYVYVGERPAEMIKSHFTFSYTRTSCFGTPSTTLTVDDTYLYWTDVVGLPHALYRRSTESRDWSGAFLAFANPRTPPGIVNSISVGGFGCGAGCRLRLPGQLALTAAEAGPTEGSSAVGGLHENWHRLYDSVTGRYLEPDSMTLGVERVPSPYAYVSDSPLGFTDRKGQQEGPCADPLCADEIDTAVKVITLWIAGQGLQNGLNPKPTPLPSPTPPPPPTPPPGGPGLCTCECTRPKPPPACTEDGIPRGDYPARGTREIIGDSGTPADSQITSWVSASQEQCVIECDERAGHIENNTGQWLFDLGPSGTDETWNPGVDAECHATFDRLQP